MACAPVQVPSCIQSCGVQPQACQAASRAGVGGDEEKEEAEEGVAPLSKSRDPHLAGGESI